MACVVFEIIPYPIPKYIAPKSQIPSAELLSSSYLNNRQPSNSRPVRKQTAHIDNDGIRNIPLTPGKRNGRVGEFGMYAVTYINVTLLSINYRIHVCLSKEAD